MAATVVPIRPGVTIEAPPPVIRRRSPEPCAVCGVRAYPDGDDYLCAGCGIAMHRECYNGRVMSLAEWQAYFRLLDGDDDHPDWPPTVCPACRAKAGA
jgi:hypothetical protein